MGLIEQQVSFKFAGGIETKMDSKAVPAVRLLGLENGVFHRAGSIKKRNGYELLSRVVDGSATVYSGAKRMAARDDELLLFTNMRCYSRQSADVDQWIDAGALIAPTGYDRPAVHTGTAQTTPDHATNGDVTVYAWEDSLGGVWWTAVDSTSGRVYRAPTQANASGERPRCVPVGEVIHVYYAVPSQHSIEVVIINPATPSSSASPLAVITDLDTTNPVFDVKPTERTGTPAFVVWHENATTNARLGYVTAGGVLGSPASGLPSVNSFALSLKSTSPLALTTYTYTSGGITTHLSVTAYIKSDDTAQAFYTNDTDGGTTINDGGTNQTLASTTSIKRIAVTFVSDTSYVDNPQVYTVYEEDAAQTSNHYCRVAHLQWNGASLDIASTMIRGLELAAGAFAVDNDGYAVFVHDTTYFNTYLTLRLSDFAPAGRHAPGSAHGASKSHVPTVYVDDENIATCALMYKTRLSSTNNDKFTETAVRRIVMDFDTEDSHQTAQFGAGLYLAGACPQHYDGYKWTEQGFHMGPEYIPYAPAAGGSMTPSSTYEYKVWYEWTDKQGEIHRGPESIGISVITGGADTQVTFTLPTLRVTRKDNVRICVARSIPGDAARLWRVTSLDPTTSGAAANGYVANDTTVDGITFIDRMSDSDLQLQEQLYTVGGTLSNDPAPLGSNIAVGRNRLFFTDAQDGSIVRFSQQRAFGFGLEVAPELQHEVDPRGGDITALHEMDDVVYAFKESAIYAFNGDGPYADGTNTSNGLVAGFSSGQLITTDVGCTDPSSIVLTPDGLMFKSAKGIYLLSRDRQVAYVGSAVEAYNAQAVRRATVMPDRTAVLFLTDSGSSLYYDYLFRQWSTFTNHEGYDAAVVSGTYHYLRTNDIVFRETIGSYADGSARITLRLETAWLHLHEHLQGFQRFWNLLLLGTYQSPHQLSVQHRLNYDEAWTDPYYLDATGDTDSAGWITGDNANPIGEDPILGSNYGDGNYGDGDYGGTGPDTYWWRYGIHEQGSSVQFRFEDFEKAGLAGASFELTEMTIVGGIDKPDMRPFAGARST